jgi:AcrR family transcriptional regulator
MASLHTEPRSADRILLSSLQLFSSKGYDATSVREICEAAGITKPTLYHFYGSKEGVYRALVEGALAPFRADVETALASGGLVRARLRGIARAYFERARTQPELVRFIFALVHNPPGTAPATDIPGFYRDVVRMIAEALDAGVMKGEFAPGRTDVRMLAFMGALAESVCAFLILGEPEITSDLADSVVDTILDGWGPR